MVELERAGDVAIITINRPESRNAIAPDTMDGLEKALDDVSDARALVITGGGERAFVSGGDLRELAKMRSGEEAYALAMRMRAICDRIAAFPGPSIAALNGNALGGGAEVAVAADIRVAADGILIGFTQATLAVMPAWGGAERLVELVGRGRALMLAGTGRVLGAAEAERLGLVDTVLPREAFEEGWRSLAASLATAAAVETKHVMRGGSTPEDTARRFARLWVTDDHWAAVDGVLSRSRK